jgi:hypothetical protein
LIIAALAQDRQAGYIAKVGFNAPDSPMALWRCNGLSDLMRLDVMCCQGRPRVLDNGIYGQ